MTNAQPIVFTLGLGSIGALLASHLERQALTSVVPLLRSQEKVSRFQAQESTLGIRTLFEEGKPVKYARFNRVSSPDTFPLDIREWTSTGQIDNLIITTKTYQTKEALEPYLKYIHPETNIILVQNGLGVLEILKEEVFVDFKPNLFQGVISHGVFQDPSTPSNAATAEDGSIPSTIFNHAGFADLKVARLPWDETQIVQSNSLLQRDRDGSELIQILMQDPIKQRLNIKHMTYQEMLLGQLEKFLVNACINPITSIVDCINGELDEIAKPIFSSIITESLDVLKVAYKPLFEYKAKNLQEFPELDVKGTLDPQRMLDFIIKVGCQVNKKNSSSMRQDVVNLRDTEVGYINGYIVKLCSKHGLPEGSCKVNKTVETLVGLRLDLNRVRDREGDLRFEN